METDQPQQETGGTAPQASPTVVGIGASAGGLAALKAFFGHVPEDSGLAWVVVVHLSPEHESHLAEILQPHVRMPVEQVSETVPLEANRVYVIPPNANLSAVDTHLRLSDLEARRRERAPIDHFFRTLASTHDGHSIGVILTGTGSDGALGVKAIKEKNGLVVVQDPNEAEFDGMPQSAIVTGLVDLVLPLVEIPAAILRYARTEPEVPVHTDEEEVRAEERQLLQKVFAQLRARTGRDFTRYKRSTLFRRIQRRMQLRQIEAFDAYVGLLREQPDETRALADDLLITVTNFFRDPEVFEALEREVIPRLFEGKGDDDSLRVWSVGCATGEEAYSLAILLLEEAARHEAPPRLQVFASDLHERSLQTAREGFYPGEIEADVSPERLRQFFVKEDGGYRIRREVRELVVFAPHNLIADPPFSRLDLVACRNVLIYLQREIQRDVAELFHFTLKPGGWLVLGTSETVDSAELFQVVDKKRCVFRKRNVTGPEPRLPVFPFTRPRLLGELERGSPAGEPVAYGVLHQRMVERYAPPSLLVSPDDRVVHLSEHAGRYLVHPGGELTASAYELVREALRVELRGALHAARAENKPVRTRPVPVEIDGETHPVVLHVRPAPEPEGHGFILVIFDERDEAAAPEAADGGGVRALEDDLGLSRQRLQAIIEQYETGQEELRASNEELQSANEELRSTLEELETSKEELQSLNEELQTVNQENRHKVEELAQLSGDLQNFMASTEIATLFLDRDLRILRYTPKVSALFNVRPADRGRPLSDLTHRLGYDALPEDAGRVLETLIPIEHEVTDEAGHWYLTRVLPYRSAEDRIEGVVLNFVDITERKRAEEEVREAKEYAEKIIETLHEPVLVLHPDLRVRTANPAFFDHFEAHPEDTLGRLIYDLGNGQWDIPDLRTLLEDVLPDSNVFNDYEVTHDFDDIGRRVMLINARRLNHVQLILLGIRDVTEKKQGEEALRESEEKYRTLFESMDEAFAVVEVLPDEQGNWVDFLFHDVNPAFMKHTGMEYPVGRTATELLGTPNPRWAETYGQVAETGEAVRMEIPEDTLGRIFDLNIFRTGDPGSHRVAVLFTDVTDRKRAEEALRESEARFRALGNATSDILYRMSPDWSEMWELHGRGFITDTKRPSETWLDEYIHPGDQLEVTAAIEEAIRTKSSFELEHRVRRVDGMPGWTLSRAVPLLDDEGEIIEWFGAATDITARKEAQEALRASEQRYRTLFESIDEGFCVVEVLFDGDGEPVDYRFLEANPAFEVQTGLHDAIGKRMRELAPAHEAYWFETYGRIARTGESERFTARADALGRWYDVYAFRVGEPEQRRVAILFNDVMERKQAEEALRTSEARFRQLAEAVPDVVFTTTPDGVVDYVSPRREEMTGQPPETALGTQMWPALIHPDDREQAMAAWREALAHGRPYEARYRVRMADGDHCWFIARARPILDDAGAIARWFGTLTDVNALTQAEEGLRESEERYRLLVESAREYAILMLDPENRITMWSTGAERVFGYTEAEALGQPGALLFTEEDCAAGIPEQELKTAAGTGRADDDRWHRRKDGTRFWATGVTEALYGEEGTLGFMKVLRDNTVRKAAEEALRESEERFRALFRESLDAILLANDEGAYVDANPAAVGLLGHERDELLEKTVGDLSGVDEATFRETWASFLEEGRMRGEYRLRTKQGDFVDVEFNAVANVLPGQHLSSLRDVTERKQAEEALRESEARLKLALRAADAGAWEYDVAREAQVMSPELFALFGVTPTPDGVIPTLWPETVPEEEHERLTAIVRRTFARRSPEWELELRVRHPERGERWFSTRGQVAYGEGGRPRRIVGIAVDVTERKRAEEALRRVNETLEERVTERTRQVRSLATRLTMAEQAERHRLAEILHDDLQQQLFGLSVLLNLLPDTETAEERQELRARAAETLAAATTLTRSLSTELSPPVLTSDRLRDLLDWLAEKKREQHGLDVDVEVDEPCVVPDHGVRVLLYRVLQEALFNVVKHAGTDRARVYARRAAVEVVVVVEDEGVGFAPEAAGEQPLGSGGFGLANVRERLKLVGGRLDVDAAPGRGTRVTIAVPVNGEKP